MHVYIIGNGVIAKSLAVCLALNKRAVTLIRGSVDNEAAYTEKITLNSNGEQYRADVTISTLANHEHLNGLIVLTNKSFGNKDLVSKLERFGKDSTIVFLQNGLGVEESFSESGFTQLYRCVLFATSQKIAPTEVRLKVVGPSPIGVISGKEATLHQIVAALNTAMFAFKPEEDIQLTIWKKAITNCVFNSICPLLEIDNGVFHRNDTALGLAKQVIKECIAVANNNSIGLTDDDVVQNVIAISKMSDGQQISTYQDILNKRETEIDTLNFAVARLGALSGIKLPVTTMLGELTRLKSELVRL